MKAEFIGALSRLDVELAGGIPLKVAVLDDRKTAAGPGSPIVFVYDPGSVTVFRQGQP